MHSASGEAYFENEITVVPDLSKGLTVDTWAIRSLFEKSFWRQILQKKLEVG